MLNILKAQMRALLPSSKPNASGDQGAEPGKGNSGTIPELQPRTLVRRADAERDGGQAEETNQVSPAQRILQSFNSTVQKAASAMVALGDEHAIAGLHEYCLRVFAPLPQLVAR